MYHRENSGVPRAAYWLPLVVLSAALAACTPDGPGGGTSTNAPATTQSGGPKPSEITAGPGPAPKLTGTGDAAKKSVQEFLDWAGASTVDQREEGRTAIQGASGNDAVAQAVADEAFKAAGQDHSRALVALAVLGELRNPVGQRELNRFVNQPLPTSGTMVEGVVLEAQDLASLEAKAVEGLAYMRNGTAQEQTLAAISQHPARVVRAAAIGAYIYNYCGNGNTGTTSNPCAVLPRYVHQDEQIFLDRPARLASESAEAFNGKLAYYLHAHPEVVPPAPEVGGDDSGPNLDPVPPGLPPER